MKKLITTVAVLGLMLPFISHASTGCRTGDIFDMYTGARCATASSVRLPCQTGDLFNYQTGKSCASNIQLPVQTSQQTVNQNFLQNQVKQNSPECIVATNNYNQLQQQYNSLKSQQNTSFNGSTFATTDSLRISSQMADISLKMTTALNQQTYACTGFVATPPRIINTSCFNYGYTISCYSN